jgi:hypothetical protein
VGLVDVGGMGLMNMEGWEQNIRIWRIRYGRRFR